MEAKRVLVTAADGFIGAHCLPVLAERGYEIHAVITEDLRIDVEGIHWYDIDLLNPRKITRLISGIRPSHLLHLAWSGHPHSIIDDPDNIRWILSGLHLLQEFADNGGRHATVLGCYSEYDHLHGICHEELTTVRPDSLHGACKHSLKLICEAYADQVEMNLVWGRVFGHYGAGDDSGKLIPSVIRALLGNKKFVCFHGSFLRDYLYIDDVASALVAVMESDFDGAINIASGEGVKIRDLVKEVAKIMGNSKLLEIHNDPGSLEDSPAVVADTKKLNNIVGWVPKISLEQGLRLTVDWWKEKPIKTRPRSSLPDSSTGKSEILGSSTTRG